MIRRIFAGSIVAVLLTVPSLAAACDLSCAFASMKSDCHAQQANPLDASSGDVNSNGMNMAGMTMPDMPNGEDHQGVSTISRAKAAHPSIGEMGPCERQSCDISSTISARTTRIVDAHFHSVLSVVETPRADRARTLCHDARDDIAKYGVRIGSPLHLSLRI
jgi:hypothetical protein